MLGSNATPAAIGRTCIGLWLLALVGCSDPPEDPEVAHAIIGPSGGLLTSTDGVLTLAIPPGALEEDVELFIRRSGEPPGVYGQAYVVRPNPVLLYDASITIRQELPDDPTGLAVGAIDIDDYEADRGRWEPLPVLRIDPEAKLVSGLDDGISVFYALLDDAEPSAATTTTTTSGGTSSTTTTTTTTTGDDPTTAGDQTTGNTDPTTGAADESTSTGDTTGASAVGYADDVEPILEASCSCHIDGVEAGLSLLDGHANLVDVPSTQVPALDRIEPGSPEDSYLWHKLHDTHASVGGTGNPMPAPVGGLAAGSLAIIEAWILDGAVP
ncbi:hypothetical protein [Paraliomyxa miuraensis]|uniref:hypothetical protein n=1 Tax=Paraliomyxa miuraensis TaxID=376150 RepID=UPI0022526BE0|nr:hypothetical protein [Paraliomyxa miuraensis]MCX4244367.1 hypothetical protein [Paraliomyxa miuraensis]